MQFSLGYRFKKTTYMDFYFCSIYKRFSVSLDVTVFTCILFTFCSIIISASHLITNSGLKHSGDGHTPHCTENWLVRQLSLLVQYWIVYFSHIFIFAYPLLGASTTDFTLFIICFSSGSPCAPLVFVSLPSCPISVWPLRSVWLHAGGSCSTDFSSPVHILPTTALAPLKSRFFVFSMRKWKRGHLQLNPRS